MMKKFKITIMSALLLFISTTACQDDYLDRFPTGSVSESSVFLTTDNAMAALNGIHRFMYIRMNPPNRQDGFGQGSININMDVLGEDYPMHSTGLGWYITEYRWLGHRTENFNLCDFPYRFYYRIIANANLIINNIDGASGPDADRNEIKAQALAYRAFSYFMLVQVYGERYVAGASNDQLGVPLILTVELEGQPRNTVEEVYTQINSDLDAAITLFGSASPRLNASHIDLSVAHGIKARISMVQGLWNNAITHAQAARADFVLMSQTEYQNGFNNYENSEWIWGSHQIQDQQGFFASYFAYISHNFSSTSIRTNPPKINNLLFDAFPSSDVRTLNFDVNGLDVSELPTSGSVSTPYQSRKYTAAASGLSIGDVPLMRAAEMYLIEAEANAHLGQDGPAADALFALNSARDDDYTLSASTGQALLDEILLYRRLELWGEGFRFLDLKRLNLPLQRTHTADGGLHNPTLTQGLVSVPAGDIRWQFLIPLSELNVNDQIVQNPQQ